MEPSGKPRRRAELSPPTTQNVTDSAYSIANAGNLHIAANVDAWCNARTTGTSGTSIRRMLIQIKDTKWIDVVLGKDDAVRMRGKKNRDKSFF
jgi:hypothetical protein